MTKIDISPKWTEVKPQGFYVYLHRRATDGSVFYVGKGKGRRAWRCGKSNYRSDHWINCARKNGVIVDILIDGMKEADAFSKEREVITIYRYIDEPIVNVCGGGVGPIGLILSDKTKAKISKSFQFPVWNHDGEKFHNASAAAREMRNRGYPKASASGINCVTSGIKGKTVYGYAWSRSGIPCKPIAVGYDGSNHDRMIGVTCLTSGVDFKSLSAAVRWVRSQGAVSASRETIKRAIDNGTMVAYGYEWKLKEK